MTTSKSTASNSDTTLATRCHAKRLVNACLAELPGRRSGIGGQAIPVKDSNAVMRVIDGEAVVVEPGKGLVTIINAVGTRIWDLTDGRRTIREIAELIAADFDVSGTKALADTLDFLRDLKEKELVTLTTRGDTPGL